jgi:hypothetical protein
MKIFLAGKNGKERLIRKLADVNIFSGGRDVNIFSGGGDPSLAS